MLPSFSSFLIVHSFVLTLFNNSLKFVSREFCVPLLFKLLRSKQTHVRLVLLKYLSLFDGSIDKEALETEVLPLVSKWNKSHRSLDLLSNLLALLLIQQ